MPKKVYGLLGLTLVGLTGILVVFFLNNGGSTLKEPANITPTLYPKPTPKLVTINIDSIEVGDYKTDNQTLPITLLATVPNGCIDITDVSTARTANVFTLTITAYEDRGVLCIEKPTPYSHIVNLDITGLSDGMYTVQAGTATTNFKLPLPINQ